MSELIHYGVLGMKWGVRKERRAAVRSERRDARWATTGKGSKITKKVQKSSSREANAYAKAVVGSPRTASGRLSMTYINAYNQKLAQLMNEKVGDIPTPSGKVLRYVAKRGEIGVHTAIADQGYNINQLSKGVHASGRVAYRKDLLRKT